MAQEWCVNYGVLSFQQAEEMNEIVQERKRKMRGGVPASPLPKQQQNKNLKKRKVRVVKEEELADVIVSGGDGIGRMTL